MPATTSPTAAETNPEALAYRIAEACRLSGLSRSGIYRAFNAGELELVKIGTATLVTAASLRAYIARLPRLQPRGAGR